MADKKASHEAVDCPHCRRSVAAEVRGAVFISELDFWVRLTECPKCEAPLLIGQTVYPPDDVDGATLLWPEHARLPKGAPQPLQRDFAEAARCFARGNYTASAIMTRRCLEGLVDELGATGRNLADRVQALSDDGVINAQLTEWAHALREVGNDAAHDTTRSVSRQDAEDVLVFAEALFDYVYTFTKKFEEFKERRGTAKGKKPPRAKKSAKAPKLAARQVLITRAATGGFVHETVPLT